MSIETGEFCEWIEDGFDERRHSTGCDNEHYFTDGNTQDNQYLFCPYCGKKIKEGDANP